MKKFIILLIINCVILFSCSKERISLQNSNSTLDTVASVSFKEDDEILVKDYAEQKCALYLTDDKNVAFYTYKKELNAATKKFLCNTSGYYYFTSNSKFLINIEDIINPFELSIYKISKWRKVETIELSNDNVDKLSNENFADIIFSESNNNLYVTYINSWNEPICEYLINLKDFIYHPVINAYNINENNDFPFVEYFEKKKYLVGLVEIDRNIGLKIEQFRNNDLSLYVNDEEKFFINDVWYFIYNPDIKKCVIVLNTDENGYSKVLLLDCISFSSQKIASCIGNDLILSEDWNFMAYFSNNEISNKKEVHYFNLSNPNDKRILLIENTIKENFTDICFVNFTYPFIGFLFELEGEYNKYVAINVLNNQSEIITIKKPEPIDYTLPDIE